MPDTERTLLDTVKHYLRVNGSGDDLLLEPLISAAKQYLLNAGVKEPDAIEENEESGELSLYELAVILYVNTIYNGGGESKLEQVLDGIILQIKDYGCSEEG